MVEVKGKCGISAKIICDSISSVDGTRLTTFEVEYPRIILAELNTHRMLSKNSSSSRAIPFEKMKEQLTGRPVRFGSNKAGMQDGGEHTELVEGPCPDYIEVGPEGAWQLAKEDAIAWAQGFADAGYHKQTFNRLTEPFQMMRTVISGTEWSNFFWLRCDEAADPSIFELASCMKEAYDKSVPQTLDPGEHHLPYVDTSRDAAGKQYFWHYLTPTEKLPLTTEDAIKVSCARSCAVSFRNSDYGLEKCLEVYERLVGAEKVHGSALEHCATPMAGEYSFVGDFPHNDPLEPSTWQEGVSHMDKNYNLWSGNFKSWVQWRKTIEGENHEHNYTHLRHH